jgi:hypothetical protein
MRARPICAAIALLDSTLLVSLRPPAAGPRAGLHRNLPSRSVPPRLTWPPSLAALLGGLRLAWPYSRIVLPGSLRAPKISYLIDAEFEALSSIRGKCLPRSPSELHWPLLFPYQSAPNAAYPTSVPAAAPRFLLGVVPYHSRLRGGRIRMSADRAHFEFRHLPMWDPVNARSAHQVFGSGSKAEDASSWACRQ